MHKNQEQRTRSEFKNHPGSQGEFTPNGAKPLTQHDGAKRVAIYARFSTDGQKDTSIDDQVRTCKETAERHGLGVTEFLVFADDAITGAGKGTHKREQYHAMRAAVREGRVDAILCDQQCRLARNAKEALTFFDELKEHRVWLLTSDGFDSKAATAQLLFGIKSVFSEFFLEETQHRVRRGMVGGFGRGAMVTALPYGYEVDAVESAKTGRCQWSIQTEEAAVVEEIFSCRKNGMSFQQIAAILNGRGVATPRDTDKKKGLYWRGTSIWRILQNPIYKGIYQVNFGKKSADGQQVSQRLMQELALVTSEDWDICQARGKRCAGGGQDESAAAPRKPRLRGAYGGGKHPLAGVLRCGVCGASLSCHKGASDNGSMHCVQCAHATNVGVSGRQPQYVSIKGVRQMLRWLLSQIVAGEAVVRYRDRLRERLAGGREVELMTARQELEKAERTKARLGRLMREIDADDPVLEQQFLTTREEILQLTRHVLELEAGVRQMNHDAIRKQLDIDLSVVVDAFLSDENAPGRTRALLNRVFPSILLKGKTDRFTAIFEVHVKPGAILAEASETTELIDGNEVMWLCLKTSGCKGAVWTVEEIEAPEVA